MSGSGRFLCLGVGEILWDLLPTGKKLGGAPANFAYHAGALGAEAWVVSRVGADPLGWELEERLRGLGLTTEGLSRDPSAATGTVGVQLDARGTPSYTIHENVAWDFLTAEEPVMRMAARADAICFGTLGQRNPAARAAIRRLLSAAPAHALRILDINLRQHYWSRELILESLALADVLKLNDEELPVVTKFLNGTDGGSDGLARLAERFRLRAVALTRGARGSTLLLAGGSPVHHPGAQLTIADTVGAGDSYTAALALGLLHGQPAGEILAFAHRVADYVCTQPGATPPLPAELRQHFSRGTERGGN